MGIKNLNKYFYDNCSKESISKIHFEKLRGKTIVIDTSIYLYQFLNENALIENMYLFISIMALYDIIPIFVFDGKPPPEKRELIKKRYEERKLAESKYKELSNSLQNMSDLEKSKIYNEMELLKRQFTRVYEEDIIKVKELLDAYKILYINSPNEADDLCVYLVKSGIAWGCLSDDMDMFVYGCPYVLRNLSLMNHTVILYNTTNILKELDFSQKHFCEITTLSGTDYNIDMKTSLSETLKYYNTYNKYINKCKTNNTRYNEFYIWLLKNTQYITNYRALLSILNIFLGKNYDNYKNIDVVVNKIDPDIKKIRLIMEKEGFIFS